MSDGDVDEIRDVLLDHSDHLAVRNVYGAHTGQGSASIRDYVESMRATGGELALVANDGAAEIYARWDGTVGRYEHLTIWPPWTIGGYDHKDSTDLTDFLEDKEAVRPTPHDYTPFADEDVLGSLSHRIHP